MRLICFWKHNLTQKGGRSLPLFLSRTQVIYHIDPSLLIFEITETAALDNLPGTRSLLRDLKQLGCGFVLDDFGVGFSSFYYLRESPDFTA